jgi:hypothetical protein
MATVDLREDELGLAVAFDRCFAAYVGLRIRREEAGRYLNQAFANCSPDWDEAGWTLRISTAQKAAARFALPRVVEVLAEIASRSLTPRLLVTALSRDPNLEALACARVRRLENRRGRAN